MARSPRSRSARAGSMLSLPPSWAAKVRSSTSRISIPSTERAARSTAAACSSDPQKTTMSLVTLAPSVPTISMPTRLPPAAPMAEARVANSPGRFGMRALTRREKAARGIGISGVWRKNGLGPCPVCPMAHTIRCRRGSSGGARLRAPGGRVGPRPRPERAQRAAREDGPGRDEGPVGGEGTGPSRQARGARGGFAPSDVTSMPGKPLSCLETCVTAAILYRDRPGQADGFSAVLGGEAFQQRHGAGENLPFLAGEGAEAGGDESVAALAARRHQLPSRIAQHHAGDPPVGGVRPALQEARFLQAGGYAGHRRWGDPLYRGQ